MRLWRDENCAAVVVLFHGCPRCCILSHAALAEVIVALAVVAVVPTVAVVVQMVAVAVAVAVAVTAVTITYLLRALLRVEA